MVLLFCAVYHRNVIKSVKIRENYHLYEIFFVSLHRETIKQGTMGSFICKQPNGKYCRFSTVVDTLTHCDMTEEEYIEMCAEKARKEARDVLENYVKPFEWVKEHFWPNNNTIEEYDQLLKELGDKEGLGAERIAKIRAELKRLEEEE